MGEVIEEKEEYTLGESEVGKDDNVQSLFAGFVLVPRLNKRSGNKDKDKEEEEENKVDEEDDKQANSPIRLDVSTKRQGTVTI